MRGFPAVLHRHLLVASLAIALILPISRARAQTGAANYPEVTVQATPAEYDWAKLGAGGRIVYISSGMRVLADRMVDNDMGTIFRFPASDPRPTVIVELAQAQLLHRVSAVFKTEDARLDVFLLDALPKDQADLRSEKGLATTVDPLQEGWFGARDFTPSSAHYVMFQWTRKNSNGPFEVAEISAVSAEPIETILAIFAEGQMHFPRQGGQDFSNNLGVPADPPIIAAVSP
jgi:hypothetical protein